MLTSVFSKNNGRYKAFVYGGNSQKKGQLFKRETYVMLIGKLECQNKWVLLN